MRADRIKLLLVEDNPADAELLLEALVAEDIGVDPDIVTDGERALAYLRRAEHFSSPPRPDIIVMDLSMPGMDGKELLSQLRLIPSIMDIPKVVLSSSSAEYDLSDALALGAIGYLVKPFDFGGYRALVHRIGNFLAA